MDYKEVKVKFVADPSRKNTFTSEIGEVRKEKGEWWAFPNFQEYKPGTGFRKRPAAEWWLKVAYSVVHQQIGEKHK